MAESFSIQEAAEKLGVHASTLRRWENEGKLIPKRTHGNQRRYELKDLKPHLARKVFLKERKTLISLKPTCYLIKKKQISIKEYKARLNFFKNNLFI